MNVNANYIEINDRSYRVEFNMAAILNFLKHEGLEAKALDEFDKLSGAQLTRLCFEGIVSGCAEEGKTFPFKYAAFVRAIYLHVINDLLLIYHFQSTGSDELKKELKKKIRNPKKKGPIFRLKKYMKLVWAG